MTGGTVAPGPSALTVRCPVCEADPGSSCVPLFPRVVAEPVHPLRAFIARDYGTPWPANGDGPVVREIPPPLNCVVCGRNAQFEVDDTSACRLHYRQVYNRAAQRRQS